MSTLLSRARYCALNIVSILTMYVCTVVRIYIFLDVGSTLTGIVYMHTYIRITASDNGGGSGSAEAAGAGACAGAGGPISRSPGRGTAGNMHCQH